VAPAVLVIVGRLLSPGTALVGDLDPDVTAVPFDPHPETAT
jgi:hypothetical protein